MCLAIEMNAGAGTVQWRKMWFDIQQNKSEGCVVLWGSGFLVFYVIDDGALRE